MLDHELIDGSDTGGLRNWHEWAKPGSVIVFDEVQKIWPLALMAAKCLKTSWHLRHIDIWASTSSLSLKARP